jgi:preprotein translocase subunit SecD
MAMCAFKIKKGYTEGKTIKAAVKNTYGKSILTILDAHVVTGAIALALVLGAVKAVKGFAVTFGLGIVVSMLIALAFAHLMVSIIVNISGGKENFLGVKREG